jgi:hypothetical protein
MKKLFLLTAALLMASGLAVAGEPAPTAPRGAQVTAASGWTGPHFVSRVALQHGGMAVFFQDGSYIYVYPEDADLFDCSLGELAGAATGALAGSRPVYLNWSNSRIVQFVVD